MESSRIESRPVLTSSSLSTGTPLPGEESCTAIAAPSRSTVAIHGEGQRKRTDCPSVRPSVREEGPGASDGWQDVLYVVDVRVMRKKSSVVGFLSFRNSNA